MCFVGFVTLVESLCRKERWWLRVFRGGHTCWILFAALSWDTDTLSVKNKREDYVSDNITPTLFIFLHKIMEACVLSRLRPISIEQQCWMCLLKCSLSICKVDGLLLVEYVESHTPKWYFTIEMNTKKYILHVSFGAFAISVLHLDLASHSLEKYSLQIHICTFVF